MPKTDRLTAYVIDDEANMDNDLGCYRYLVIYDEDGENEEQEIARFKDESDADKFAEMKNV